MMGSRRIVYLILILAIMVSGCGMDMSSGGETPSGGNEEIVLLDPVNDSSGWEMAACRNLYDAKIYSATVFPYTEEYAFDRSVVFDWYNTYPGESVKKGGVLAYADNSALEKSIENKEEEIQKMEEDFQEYKKEVEEALYEQQFQVDNLWEIVENLRDQEPEEYITVIESPAGTSGDGSAEGAVSKPGTPVRKKNPEYAQWQALHYRYEGDYRILAHSVDTSRVQLEQRTQLYELDHAYALKQLKKLKEQLKQSILVSPMDGTVVAIAMKKGRGSTADPNEIMIAVGDMQQKMLKCQYINKATAAGAKDIYAMIDGRRYEVVYQAMDAEEYTRLSTQGETVYTTFELAEDAENVSVGDFAVITVVNDYKENVLSVPQSAIHTDSEGTFVYIREGEESVAVGVETGMSDGVYTEILSGIKEGDWVLSEETLRPGEGRKVLKTGNYHSNFAGNGYMTYYSVSTVCNPITYGTVYFTEYTKSLYEHVEKGEVIARIRVQQDDVALKRNQVRLERLQERLAALEKEEDVDEKVLASKREEVAEAQKLIDEMMADYAVTEIKAEQSGIITNVEHHKREDILGRDAGLVTIADENICYVLLDDKNQLLQYGNKVTVSYFDKQGDPRSTTGKVASLSEAGVSKDLESDFAMIQLPPDAIGNMAAATPDQNDWWSRAVFKVEADIREMDDVCLVPKEAVWAIDGQTYVLVVEADGSVTARSFISGGNDASYYWVVDGLTEGMEICVK